MLDYTQEILRRMHEEAERTRSYDEAFYSMTRNERRIASGRLVLAEARIKDLERQLSRLGPTNESDAGVV